MRESFTAVLERNRTLAGEFATEPYEAAWAAEARWFVRTLKRTGSGTRLRVTTQISPDGLHWCDLDAGREITGDLDYDVWRRGVGAGLLRHPRAAIFSHYVAINAAVSCVTGADEVLSFRPDHCSITTFAIESGRLQLIDYGREAETQVL